MADLRHLIERARRAVRDWLNAPDKLTPVERNALYLRLMAAERADVIDKAGQLWLATERRRRGIHVPRARAGVARRDDVGDQLASTSSRGGR